MQHLKRNYVTHEGYDELKNELNNRKTTIRKEIADRIKYAKEFGDLSENAAYTEARESQNENENRIRELEDLVLISEVVEKDKNDKSIQIGSTFEVELNGKDFKYTLVGPQEADPTIFKISHESPLGKCFLGREEGEEIEFKTPSGTNMKFKVKKVK